MFVLFVCTMTAVTRLGTRSSGTQAPTSLRLIHHHRHYSSFPSSSSSSSSSLSPGLAFRQQLILPLFLLTSLPPAVSSSVQRDDYLPKIQTGRFVYFWLTLGYIDRTPHHLSRLRSSSFFHLNHHHLLFSQLFESVCHPAPSSLTTFCPSQRGIVCHILRFLRFQGNERARPTAKRQTRAVGPLSSVEAKLQLIT